MSPQEELADHGINIARDCLGMAAQIRTWRRGVRPAIEDEIISSGSLPRKEGGW
jgi:hypothetical protein